MSVDGSVLEGLVSGVNNKIHIPYSDLEVGPVFVN